MQFVAPELDAFMKQWRKMIMHGGSACLLFEEVFGRKPAKGAGVRWYIKWEQVGQIQGEPVGLERLLSQVVDVCVIRKYSEKSAKKMQALGQDCRTLASALVQSAAVVDGGKIFCWATYWLESKEFISPVTCEVFQFIEDHLNNGIPLPLVEKAAKRAAKLMEPLVKTWADKIAAADADVQASDVVLAAARAAAAGPAAQNPAGGNMRRRPQRAAAAAVPNAAVVVAGRAEEKQVEAAQAQAGLIGAVTVAEAEQREAKQAAQKIKDDEQAWRTGAGPLTEEDFVLAAAQVVQPGYDYFRKLYLNPEGKLYSLRLAFYGASVLNPLVLRDIEQTSAELLVDNLKYFEFPEFTPEFLAEVKKELPQLMHQARQDFDWDSLDGAEDYNRTLTAKLKAKEAAAAKAAARTASIEESKRGDGRPIAVDLTREVQARTWLDDPAEKGRRIWLWWRPRVNGVNWFRCLPTVLRLVALVQPSSAAVERIFSKLKLILDACGNNMLEETLETRIFKMYNKQ